jgi:hypothetical protein
MSPDAFLFRKTEKLITIILIVSSPSDSIHSVHVPYSEFDGDYAAVFRFKCVCTKIK